MIIKIKTEGGNNIELHDIHADDKIVDIHIKDSGNTVTLQVAKKDLLAAVKAICR